MRGHGPAEADVGHAPSPAATLDPLLELPPEADEAAVLGCAAHAIAALLGDRASCVLFDGPPRVVLATHAPALRNWPLDLALYPEIELAAQQRSLVFVEDVRSDSRMNGVRALMPRNLRSVAAVPILLGQRCLGVLVAQASTVRHPSPEQLAQATAVGRLTGHLLDAGRLRRASPPLDLGGAPPRPARSAAVVSAQGAQTLRIPAVRAPPPADGRRLLLVEDDEDQAALVAGILGNAGHAVETVQDGLTAIRRARESRPEAILLDVCMPVLDGFATAKQLKADPATAEVPILFLSGCDDLMVRVEGLRLGAADFLVKPFFAPELLARVERVLEQGELRARLEERAHTDELTGLGNLRFLQERFALELSRAERYGTPLSLAMIDVDGLKRINDRFGHTTGSRVLAEVGHVLADESRDTDVAARYGGDEFVVLLPHAALPDALTFAKRVLVRSMEIDVGGPTVSLSLGVASLGDGGALDGRSLIERADAAAYRAKREGGNRVRAAAEEPPTTPPTPSSCAG
jgi:diguanylate cyclase (GGDEF)-like protein